METAWAKPFSLELDIMADDRQQTDAEDTLSEDTAADDTEGHQMLADPNSARHLARVRQQEVDKGARDRQNRKDARGR